MTNAIVQQATNSGALNASHYQTFEMAKANDCIIGGDDIAQIRTYAAYVRAQAQVIHKTIAATSSIDDVVTVKEEMTESEQTLAKVGIFCDQRIGEILRELPTRQGARNDITSVGTPTKVEAEKQANIDHHTAIDLQKLAANPEVVQMVIDKAEEEGRIVSRSQVLKVIKERDEARDELESLRSAEPEVIEREVEVESQESKRRIAELERENKQLNDEYQQMWAKKRDADKRLQQANELLGENERNNNARRDVEQLTIATNSYLRNYGGKLWAFDQFYRVDETTQQEFIKAITSLAAFAQNMAAMVSERNQENS